MTYPDRQLRRFLRENFIFLQIDLSRRDPSLNELFRTIKPFWAPLFHARSPRGIELRRWFGFFPPVDLRLELEIVLAADLMLQRRDTDALQRLERAIEGNETRPAAPEMIFWKGVAAFKAGGGDHEALRSIWTELIERWPESTWASRADVLEMSPE